MDKQELAKMTGQTGIERNPVYRLNEVKMSGDDGKFSLREVLGEKGEDGKYPVKELGETIKGVIIKMRWRLFRYEEVGETVTTYLTSEFDFKNKDTVVLFNNGKKGLAADIKEEYNLGSQRVLYVYLPSQKEIVRVIVKASALSGEKNPNGELGLFDYVNQFEADQLFIHEFNTEFGSVYREDTKNKRKSYYAMTFKRGTPVLPENQGTIDGYIREVHERTTGTPFAETYQKQEEEINYPADDEVNPDDIPF